MLLLLLPLLLLMTMMIMIAADASAAGVVQSAMGTSAGGPRQARVECPANFGLWVVFSSVRAQNVHMVQAADHPLSS